MVYNYSLEDTVCQEGNTDLVVWRWLVVSCGRIHEQNQ